jgi:hypothetical protein
MVRPKAKLLLLMAGVTAGLLIAELFLRVFIPQETKRLAVYDKELGWRGSPDGEGLYIREKDMIRVPFKYNSEGFRDEDFPPTTAAGVRILLLGDSFVESLEVPYEQTFHERVEEELKRAVDDSCVVINISSQGYSTAQELLAYRKFREQLHPQIVLLAFYSGNDFEDNLRPSFALLDQEGHLRFPPNEDSWLSVQSQTLQRWLYEHSHLVFFIKNAVENLFHQRINPEAKREVRVSVEEKYRITQSLLRELANEVRRDNVQFGVILIPGRRDVNGHSGEKLHVIIQECEDAGIPLLRLDHVLVPEHFFEFDEHLNESGHEIVTKEIVRFLVSSFDLKRSRAES